MPLSQLQDDLEARKICVFLKETRLDIEVDARDYVHTSYSLKVKLIWITYLVNVTNALEIN